jgi:hypothetical protein
MRYLGEVCYFIQAKVTERVTSRTILILETARVDGLGMLGLKERISKLIKQKRTKRKLGLRVQVQEKDRQKRNNNEWHDRNIVRSGEKETSVLIRDGMWRPSKGKGALHRTFMSGSDDLPDMQDIIDGDAISSVRRMRPFAGASSSKLEVEAVDVAEWLLGRSQHPCASTLTVVSSYHKGQCSRSLIPLFRPCFGTTTVRRSCHDG